MGDRYEFTQKCPNCFNQIHCYYAESCGQTTIKCANCGMEFNIVIDFKLEELHPREVKPEGLGVADVYVCRLDGVSEPLL